MKPNEYNKKRMETIRKPSITPVKCPECSSDILQAIYRKYCHKTFDKQ